MGTISLQIPLSGEVLTILSYTEKYFCSRDMCLRRHAHMLDELHIILSGNCKLEVEKKQIDLFPGRVVLVRAGEFHVASELQSGLERCSFLLSVQPNAHLDKQLELLSHTPITVSNEVIDLCRQLDRDIEQAAPYYTDLLAAKLTHLIIEILRSLGSSEHPNAKLVERTQLQTTLLTIDRFFCPWPNAIGSESDLSQLLNISRHKLNRIILQHYGVNFREKLRMAKMDYASWLLRRTDYTCRQIATLCGYSADTSFHKAFRDNFDLSPQAYRKKFRENDSEHTISED